MASHTFFSVVVSPILHPLLFFLGYSILRFTVAAPFLDSNLLLLTGLLSVTRLFDLRELLSI